MATPASPLPTPAPPVAPSGTLVYSAGPGTVTLTYDNGAVSTLEGPLLLHASTSYDAAEVSSYSQAMQSWSSQLQNPAPTGFATTTTARPLQPNATQQSGASGLPPTPTTPGAPPEQKPLRMVDNVPTGIVVGCLISVLVAIAAVVVLWLRCRKRRTRRSRISSAYKRHDDKGEKSERSRTVSHSGSFSQTGSAHAFLFAESTAAPLSAATSPTHVWSPTASTLQLDAFSDRAQPLSPIAEEATYHTEPLSPTSARSMRTFGAHQLGAKEPHGVGQHGGGWVNANRSTTSLNSLQRLNRPDEPRPSTASSTSPLFAAMSQSQRDAPAPEPVAERSVRPKSRGLVVSLGESSIDWQRFSFGTEGTEGEEQVVAKSASEDNVTSGPSETAPPVTQHGQTQDGSSAATNVERDIVQQGFGSYRFGESFMSLGTPSTSDGGSTPGSARTIVGGAEQGTTASAPSERTLSEACGSPTSSRSSIATLKAAYMPSSPGASSGVEQQRSLRRGPSAESQIDPFTSAGAMRSEITLVALPPVGK